MKECSWEALSFVYANPINFYSIACQKSDKPSLILMIFRACLWAYSFAIIIWLLCEVFIDPNQKFLASYCTFAQILWAFTADTGFLVAYKGIRKFDPDIFEGGLPWYIKFYLVVLSASLPSLVISFIVFWSQMPHENINLLYIFLGNVTPFLGLLEVSLIAFPLRIINFFYFILFNLLYVIISVVYQKLGGHGLNETPYIYKNLDWRDPKSAVLTCFIALLIGETAYVIFWAFIKLKLSKWCCERDT